MKQIYTWGDVGRDPRTRIITVAHMALVDSINLNVKADDDADDARWFTVECLLEKVKKSLNGREYKVDYYYKIILDNDIQKISALVKVRKVIAPKNTQIIRTIIETDNIAVDHAKVIQHAIETLRYEVENKSLLFSIMPDEFDLQELKKIYEILVNKKISEEEFNLKVSKILIETNGKYKFDKEWVENFM